MGFGAFEVKKCVVHIGRNPKTKEAITIPASNHIKVSTLEDKVLAEAEGSREATATLVPNQPYLVSWTTPGGVGYATIIRQTLPWAHFYMSKRRPLREEEESICCLNAIK